MPTTSFPTSLYLLPHLKLALEPSPIAPVPQVAFEWDVCCPSHFPRDEVHPLLFSYPLALVCAGVKTIVGLEQSPRALRQRLPHRVACGPLTCRHRELT
jgi:hypothetical protein